MRFTSVPLRKPMCDGAPALLLAAVLPGGAATPATTEGARYQRERALCTAFRVHSRRADCRIEVSTAHHARLPPVADLDPGRYERNALERRKRLPELDRQDSVQRVRCQGTTGGSGSVASGGICRKLVTVTRIEPATAPG